MAKRTRILLVSGGVLLALVVAALLVSIGRTPPSPLLPNPNGYDDFVKAGMALVRTRGEASAFDHDELHAWLSSNSEPLRLVRLGLTRECRVTPGYTRTNLTASFDQLANLKSLAQLFKEEGRCAEMENRDSDAAKSYIDAIRFGNQAGRGGSLIHRLVGLACEAIGASSLARLASTLTPDEARSVIADLEKIDATHLSWTEVRRNEEEFSRYQLSKTFNPLVRIMAWQETRRAIQGGEIRNKRVLAHERLLALELALRAYKSEQGQPPLRLEQLVPAYLQRVPLDPFTDRPMIYRPQGAGWLVYSVGEDGVDDGGQRVGRSSRGTVARGDIFFDSFY